MARVILVLPAYNEAGNIAPLLQSAVETFNSNGIDYSLIVVNDGSTDNTAAVVRNLSPGINAQLVEHPQNLGLGAAIKTGITMSLATADRPDDIIVNMDADNTHDPAYIPQMVDKIVNGEYDVVIASRFRSGSREVGVPFFRRLLSRGARFLFEIFLRLPEVRDYTCGYRAYRSDLLRRAVDKYGDRLITRQGFACTDELLVHLSTITHRMTEIPFVLRYDKKQSRSKLPLFRTIWETLKMLAFRE